MKKSLSLLVVFAVLLSCFSVHARAFAGVAPYFEDEVAAAQAAGLIPELLLDADLSQPITRAEFCHIALRAFEVLTGMPTVFHAQNYFTDTHDAAIDAAYVLGIVHGRGDGTFAPDSPITRIELFQMLYNLMLAIDYSVSIPAQDLPGYLSPFSDGAQVQSWGIEATSALLKLGLVNGVGDAVLDPTGYASRAQGLVLAMRLYAFDPQALSAEPAQDLPADETTDALPMPDLSALPDELFAVGYSRAKENYIFGGQNARYTSAAEAETHMVTFSVPVWNFDSSGQKVSTTRTVTVNKAIEPMVLAIFTEIYNGDERFPIYSLHSYAWRGGSSEHNYGLAIDINPTENYMIKNGIILSGELWQPGTNPYSIPLDGDVVQAFARYGFDWGGTAWRSNQDYMHFSYQGQ